VEGIWHCPCVLRDGYVLTCKDFRFLDFFHKAHNFLVGICFASVFTSVAAMVAAGGTLVYVAGFLSIILSPYAVYQQKQLIDIEALEGTRDQLEEEVSKLRKNNEKLNDNVQDLEGTVSRLKDVENALDILTQTQGL